MEDCTGSAAAAGGRSIHSFDLPPVYRYKQSHMQANIDSERQKRNQSTETGVLNVMLP